MTSNLFYSEYFPYVKCAHKNYLKGKFFLCCCIHKISLLSIGGGIFIHCVNPRSLSFCNNSAADRITSLHLIFILHVWGWCLWAWRNCAVMIARVPFATCANAYTDIYMRECSCMCWRHGRNTHIPCPTHRLTRYWRKCYNSIGNSVSVPVPPRRSGSFVPLTGGAQLGWRTSCRGPHHADEPRELHHRQKEIV